MPDFANDTFGVSAPDWRLSAVTKQTCLQRKNNASRDALFRQMPLKYPASGANSSSSWCGDEPCTTAAGIRIVGPGAFQQRTFANCADIVGTILISSARIGAVRKSGDIVPTIIAF